MNKTPEVKEGQKPWQNLACGACGKGDFQMSYQGFDEGGFRLMAICKACASTTLIEPKRAELTMYWGPESEGMLCRMEPKA